MEAFNDKEGQILDTIITLREDLQQYAARIREFNSDIDVLQRRLETLLNSRASFQEKADNINANLLSLKKQLMDLSSRTSVAIQIGAESSQPCEDFIDQLESRSKL
jgi:chromosome segregation ATPase